MTEIEILTISEALQRLGKTFSRFMHPERVFKNKLKKMGIKPLNGTITARQLEEFIEKCYTLGKEEKTGMFMERSVLVTRRRKSKNTLAAAIASRKQKNMQVA